MLKKKLLIIALVLCLFNLNAQEENNITLRIEPGLLVVSDSENLGFFLNVEPNIKISYNTVFGLRFGATVNSLSLENYSSTQFMINEESNNGVISFVPTFDYYLNENYTRPYLGLGIGYYLLVGYLDVSPVGSVNVLEGSVNDQAGFLLRGGFELGKTKLGLEYNFIPKADIKIPNGQIIGKVDSSYFGLSIGFTIGGGKG